MQSCCQGRVRLVWVGRGEVRKGSVSQDGVEWEMMASVGLVSVRWKDLCIFGLYDM